MRKKITLEEVKKYIESDEGNGCKLLSTEYENSKTELEILCACGEIFHTDFSKFKCGKKQCKKCGIKIRADKRKEGRIYFNCDYCGLEHSRPKSTYNFNGLNFCSKDCYDNYKKERYVTFNCDYCGKEKTVNKFAYESKKHHFCSKDCYDKWKSENLAGENSYSYGKHPSKETRKKMSDAKKGKYIGENHPNWKGGGVDFNCDYCGKEWNCDKSQYDKSKYHFCSIECHGKWLSENNLRENHPNWKEDKTDEERKKERKYFEYYDWRKQVYERDDYTCQCCRKKGGNINAHHLNGYDNFKDYRTDVNNGIALCEDCHKELHSIYGYGNNTIEQFREFLYNKYLQTKDIKYLVALEDTDIRKYVMKLNDKKG